MGCPLIVGKVAYLAALWHEVVCCLNRPFDDQSEGRIGLEAVPMYVRSRREAAEWEWISSEVVDVEIGRTPDPERRRQVLCLS